MLKNDAGKGAQFEAEYEYGWRGVTWKTRRGRFPAELCSNANRKARSAKNTRTPILHNVCERRARQQSSRVAVFARVGRSIDPTAARCHVRAQRHVGFLSVQPRFATFPTHTTLQSHIYVVIRGAWQIGMCTIQLSYK